MNAPRPRPPHLPGSYLVLELTNRCSLACVHCSVSEAGHAHHTTLGMLDPRLALALFDDLAAVGARFDTLILFWLGEPLLHPHFPAIYQAALRVSARAQVFGQVEVHTNGTHLNAARARVALNAGDVRQVWHFSLDAARRDTYRLIKGVDLFERVESQVESFVAEKGRLGAPWPRLVFQFIVSDKNQAEVPQFRRRWESACRRAGLPVRAAAQLVPQGEDAVVFFRQLDCPTVEEQSRQNAVFREAMAREGLALPREEKSATTLHTPELRPCSGFWKSPVIGWRGDVTVCTRDNLLENRLGSLKDRPFSAMWWGDALAKRRSQVAQGDYGGLKLCATCFIPKSANYTDLSPADIRAQAAFDGSPR